MYGRKESIDDLLYLIGRRHLKAKVKFLGSDEFVETDLADIKEPTYFRSTNGTYISKEEKPFHPDDMYCRVLAWRDALLHFPMLIEVKRE